VGVHGRAVELHLERLWSHNITLTTRLVDTMTTPLLLKQLAAGRLPANRLVTQRVSLGDAMKAYDALANATRERALKVVLKNA
jgi:alcohol dehydrogenase